MRGWVAALGAAGALGGAAQAADAPHDWVAIGTTANQTAITFVDASTIASRADGIVQFRQAWVLATSTNDGTAAMIASVEGDCGKRRMRRISIDVWRSEGTLLDKGPASGEWEDQAAGTAGAGVLDFVCDTPAGRAAGKFPHTKDVLPIAAGRKLMVGSTS